MHSVNIDPRKLRAVALMAPKDEIRYYLNGVLLEITPDGVIYVATNGHALIAFRDERPENDEPYAPAQIIVPRDVARSVKPLNRHVERVTLQHDGLAMATLSNLKGADLSFKPIDGKYPDWRRVVPKECDGTKGCYNPELLATFSAIARELANNRDAIPVVTVAQNGTGCALVKWSDADNYIGAVMPWRITSDEHKAPAWIAYPQAEKKAA